MAENKIIFLTEVELPPYCFLSEAIEWIALGRVPQMQPDVDIHTDEVSDYRFSWEHMPDNFEPKFEYAWFDQREFESLGIQVTEEYFSAAEVCHSECISDLPNQIAEYEAGNQRIIKLEDGTQIDIFTQMASDARAKLEKFGPQKIIVDETEAQFKPYLEVACAKLFQLLIRQEVTCQAVDYDRWNRLADEDEYEKAAQFENVPIRAFTLGMDWMKNEIQIDGQTFVALRIKTQDIINNRALLLQSGEILSVERFGTFYTSSNYRQSNQRRKAGRRSALNWDALKAYLRERSYAEALPDQKENCIYELIAYAENTLGKPISRTAVQRNLRAELDALYA